MKLSEFTEKKKFSFFFLSKGQNKDKWMETAVTGRLSVSVRRDI